MIRLVCIVFQLNYETIIIFMAFLVLALLWKSCRAITYYCWSSILPWPHFCKDHACLVPLWLQWCKAKFPHHNITLAIACTRSLKQTTEAFLNGNRNWISSHIDPIFRSPCDIILQINCNAIILWSHKPSFILWPSWFFCYSTLQMNLLNLLYVCGFPFFWSWNVFLIYSSIRF